MAATDGLHTRSRHARRAVVAGSLVAWLMAAALVSAAAGMPRADRGGKPMRGSARADRLHGGPRGDRIAGRGGLDRIWGGSGSDRISGGRGADRVFGGAGNDRIDGDSGADRIDGQSGRDRISGGPGRDRLSGGRGADRIVALGGGRDAIDCGSGRDAVYADPDDRPRNCESVRLPRSARPPVPPGSPPSSEPRGGAPFDPPPEPARRPNILLIVTDDQRYDTVTRDFMPTVSRELVDQGLSFSRAYVTRPLCCPSRASILTGQYAHNHGVKTNWFEGNGDPDLHGGFGAFKDQSTLATWLHGAGYRTGLAGKYLNEYGLGGDGSGFGQNRYVPPGWDSFVTFAGDPGYYDYSLNVDGRTIESHACESYGDGGRPDGCDPADYSTSVFARHATEFVRESGGERPFFLMFTPYAPHMPAEAAPGDEGKFRDFRHRPGSFNEEDLGDKPNWLRESHGKPLSDKDVRDIDSRRVRQARSLLGVDRAVQYLIDELGRSGELDDTLIVFTSDNGYLWGEHRIEGKLTAYQESIRAPLIVKGPGVRHGSTDLIAANIDLAPTLADVAQATRSLTSIHR